MKICAIAWCAAFATNGDYCQVHATDPTLHPEPLAADEVFAPELAPCQECEASGECQTCGGDGECNDGSYRRDCDTCGARVEAHECRQCEGNGKCKHCHGEGRVSFTKKPTDEPVASGRR